MKKIILIAAAMGLMSLTACDRDARVDQAAKGKERAERVMANAGTNAEQDNIEARLKLTSDPNLLGHIAIVNKVGQVVLYTSIKGKITSGSKRMSNPTACGTNVGDCPSDEGTFGSSNPYIFFWTANGQYIQTSMDYIYSDKPLRLDEKPIFTVPQTPAPAASPTPAK